ncbi:MAG TPA: hypothetical protein PLP17_00555 [Oligoflexia bacterium]|nr:hypothetical protein [Oligoflexia bacterium]
MGHASRMLRIAGAIMCIAVVVGEPRCAQAIELQIFNNMKEKEPGSIFMIENARSAEAPDNKIQFRVLPGETKNITGGNVIAFVLVRVFHDHKLKYDVSCPADAQGAHKITLIDVHDNKLPGGCKVERTGHWSKMTGMNWGHL